MMPLARLSVAGLLLSSAALAAGPPAQVATVPFSLTRVVPADVYLYVAWRPNAERQFIEQYWDDVFDVAGRSGIAEALLDVIHTWIGPQRARQAQEAGRRLRAALAGLEWSGLNAGEGAFIQRLAKPGPAADGGPDVRPPQMAWLWRVPDRQARDGFLQLSIVLKTMVQGINALAAASPALVVERHSRQNAEMAWVCRATDPPEKLGAGVLRHGDVVCIVLGEQLLEDILRLLVSEQPSASLGGRQRFQAALSSLPPAEDAVVFFDFQAVIQPLRQALPPLPPPAEPARSEETAARDSSREPLRGLLRVALDLAEIWDYSASVHWTDGDAVHRRTVTALVSDAATRPAHGLVAGCQPLQKFDRFLPRETRSFTVSSGCDPLAQYGVLENVLRDSGPRGRAWLEWFEALQAGQDFDVRRDILSWLSGGQARITLEGGRGALWLFGVRDEGQAREKVAMLTRHVAARLAQLAREHPALAMFALRTTALDHPELVGFENIHFALWPRPLVWGVAEGHLLVGTSADAVALCLRTARGAHPGVRENSRLMSEALLPAGPFHRIALSDHRELPYQLGAAAGVVSTLCAVAAASMPTMSQGDLIGKIGTLVGRLTPVARHINFYKSSASWSILDGQAWHTHQVTHYFQPHERPAAAGLQAGPKPAAKVGARAHTRETPSR